MGRRNERSVSIKTAILKKIKQKLQVQTRLSRSTAQTTLTSQTRQSDQPGIPTRPSETLAQARPTRPKGQTRPARPKVKLLTQASARGSKETNQISQTRCKQNCVSVVVVVGAASLDLPETSLARIQAKSSAPGSNQTNQTNQTSQTSQTRSHPGNRR